MIKYLRYSFLSMLMLVCGSVAAQTTVTFDATVDKSGGSSAANDVSISKDGVTILVSNGILGNGSEYRIYANKTMTVTAPANSLITSIKITSTANSGSNNGPDKLSTEKGSYVTESGSKVGTWTGSEAEVVFSASAQSRAKTIEVTYIAAGADVVLSPTISAEDNFLGNTVVTIEAAEGCDIYYTIDETDPTTSSTKYTASFAIDKTTTVKAIAVKGGKSSDIAEKTFNKVALEASTIGYLNEKTEDQAWIHLKFEEAVVTYVDGTNIYLREKDGKALLLYGIDFSSHASNPIKAGDKLQGSIICDYDNYYGIHEVKTNKFTNVSEVSVTEGSAPAPIQASLSDILNNKYICDYVLVKGKIISEVSGTKTNYFVSDDADNKVQLYKGLDVSGFADNSVEYYITAVFNAFYNGNPEIQPIAVSENNPTAISTVKAEAASDNVIYNLAGQRMSKLSKGINIVNGKKIIK